MSGVLQPQTPLEALSPGRSRTCPGHGPKSRSQASRPGQPAGQSAVRSGACAPAALPGGKHARANANCPELKLHNEYAMHARTI
eukprot:5799333-Alexandrium_andersonii.AAC.1